MMATVHEMLDMGFTPTEVDQMTGKAIGHATAATFRTRDLVGLDVLVHVNKNLYPAVPDDEDATSSSCPRSSTRCSRRSFLATRPEERFFKKSVDSDGNRVILELDLDTFEYKPQEKTRFPSLEAAKQIDDSRQANQDSCMGRGQRRRVSVENDLENAPVRGQPDPRDSG